METIFLLYPCDPAEKIEIIYLVLQGANYFMLTGEITKDVYLRQSSSYVHKPVNFWCPAEVLYPC